jgi:hypothetical protein
MERGNSRLKPGSWSAAHPNEGDGERWKGSPTTETTGDDGSNARVAGEHARDENVPARGKPRPPRARSARPRAPRAPAEGAQRAPTRH